MPGFLDGLNPFAGAADGWGDTSYFPPAPSAPQAPSMVPTSRQQSLPGYSPLRDPEGPLARAGWIGALMATGPSRSEALLAQQRQKEQQIGSLRGQAYKKLSQLVGEGQTPQKAFLSFINTPEGMNFIVGDPDPQEAIASFMKMATPDPAQKLLANRNSVLGGLDAQPSGQPAPATAPVAQPANPATILAQPPAELGGPPMPTPVDRVANPPAPAAGTGSQPVMVGDTQLPAGMTGDKLRKAALQLATVGDMEGSKLAADLAEQYDKQFAAQNPSTDDIKEYEYYKKGMEKRGQTPMSAEDFWVKMKTSSSNRDDPGVVRQKQLFELDAPAAKAAAEAASAARQALPALEQATKIAESVPGGYQGTLAPYIGRIKEAFGIPPTEGQTDAELLQSVAMQLVPIVRQPGQVSNYEQQTYLNAVPSLAQTQAGRVKIIGLMQKQAQRAQEIAQVYRKYAGKEELNDRLADLDQKPIFDATTLKELQEAGKTPPTPTAGQPAATPTPAAAASNPPQIGGIDDYNKLKAGDQFIDLDGNLRTKGNRGKK